jgi:hypothetical protein
MPTARELLEQADALMRRNRLATSVADDGIPILTDNVPPPRPAALAPVTAPSVGPPAVPAVPPAAPAGTTAVLPAAHDALPAAGHAAPPAAAQAAPPAAPVMDLDDVPLLTDAVEEIEAPSILDVPDDDEAGADAWTETLTGSHPTEAGTPAPEAQSNITAVPVASMATGPIESIDIAPPPPEEPAVVERTWYDPNAVAIPSPPPAEEMSRPGADDTRRPAAEDLLPPAADDSPSFAAEDSPLSATGDLSSRAVEPVPPPDPDVGQHARAFDEHEAEGIEATSAPQPDAPVEDQPVDGSFASQPGALAEREPHPTIASPTHPVPSHTEQLAPEPQSVVPPEPQPVAATAIADEARWAQLAEEVRMQVLQRIDLVTDTGLREQLAARLQPIVDRASADLVATINQHVGVLLRAYVAEAIEREIERWRDQSR